jgi:hypothetical protein
MPRLTECPCGSGQQPIAHVDGYGIFLCYTCDDCHDDQMAKYRSDIMEQYWAEEPIEED